MELIIRGKRSEGKSFLACLIEDLLHQAGYVVRSTEVDGNRRKERHQEGAVIDFRLLPRFVRNVNITVEQNTQEMWDGKVVIDSTMAEAEKKHRRNCPNLYKGENDGT